MDTKKIKNLTKTRNLEHCEHPRLAKEFTAKEPTGDYVCTQCGRPLSALLNMRRH
jgi:hypothetical protein